MKVLMKRLYINLKKGSIEYPKNIYILDENDLNIDNIENKITKKINIHENNKEYLNVKLNNSTNLYYKKYAFGNSTAKYHIIDINNLVDYFIGDLEYAKQILNTKIKTLNKQKNIIKSHLKIKLEDIPEFNMYISPITEYNERSLRTSYIRIFIAEYHDIFSPNSISLRYINYQNKIKNNRLDINGEYILTKNKELAYNKRRYNLEDNLDIINNILDKYNNILKILNKYNLDNLIEFII